MAFFKKCNPDIKPLLFAIFPVIAACSLSGNQPIAFKEQIAVGEHFMQMGEYDRAYRLLDGVSESQKGSATAQLEVADAYLRTNALLRAQQAYAEAAALGAKEAANIGYGKIALRRNDPDTAQKYFAEALAKNQTEPELLNVVGVAYDLQGNHYLAQKSYRLALNFNPEHHNALNNLGLSLLLSGNATAAVELLSDLTESRLDDQTSRINLGLALAAVGQRHSAQRLLQNEMSGADAETLFAAIKGYRAEAKL